MFYLLYDPLDRIQTFTLVEVNDNTIFCYSWFSLDTLPNLSSKYDGKLENTSIDYLMKDTFWVIAASFPSAPTADQLQRYIHSHPELLI